MRLTEGGDPVLGGVSCQDPIKPNHVGDPEAGQGAEGGRFKDSTDALRADDLW